MQQSNIGLHHQNFMLAVRREMGWPGFKPANDAIAFCSGRRMDLEVGSEMARIAQTLRKDAVYTSWANMAATAPLGFTIVYREMLTVDIVDRVVPYAANDDGPILFVSTRADEHFAVDRRGSLVRVPGKPKAIGTGRKLAMQRIRATAATMGDELLANNRFVPFGSDWSEPETPVETIVRFG
ncbi:MULTISPECIES: hypothetical protein [Sphingomonas]|jgi:hypothetical protein|uniref:Uncharacterized protein n=1 Tax=Sphingomonas hankookensis TaxID=563996 RepID=A0ABR5Y975_9SPHN|nr:MULTISPECIES: hypothetical protein [Sphingomonas]KZE11219.1 hypothetical protein AVT10_17160 [Sphingomonas hankookensis]PZT95080.1 MAG: hypothetical protein DI625_06080 [Sphingomonas sp.]WCP73381.1 hypothetical protein PPZ50_07515 [Sphingomonas hankookensis]